MSQFIDIFCRAVRTASREELTEFATDAWYGDDPPLFHWRPDTGDWKHVEIMLPGGARPVSLDVDTDPAFLGELAHEALDRIGGRATDTVRTFLLGARSAVGVEIFPDHCDDDTWEFVTVLMWFLAEHGGGVIVDDDNIYGADAVRMRRPDR